MRYFSSQFAQSCRLLWAAPCSLVGLLLGATLLAFGGSCRRVGHTLEFSRFAACTPPDSVFARLPWQGITFGHVILGSSASALQALRSHERVHVRQYERWGVFFFLAYPLSSLFALLRGHCPYRGNAFEQEAYGEAETAGWAS